jgi:hypothetical protein
MIIEVKLTLDNGLTRSITYEVPYTRQYAGVIFDKLKKIAWDATYGQTDRILAAEGDDNLSREASHYHP